MPAAWGASGTGGTRRPPPSQRCTHACLRPAQGGACLLARPCAQAPVHPAGEDALVADLGQHGLSAAACSGEPRQLAQLRGTCASGSRSANRLQGHVAGQPLHLGAPGCASCRGSPKLVQVHLPAAVGVQQVHHLHDCALLQHPRQKQRERGCSRAFLASASEMAMKELPATRSCRGRCQRVGWRRGEGRRVPQC